MKTRYWNATPGQFINKNNGASINISIPDLVWEQRQWNDTLVETIYDCTESNQQLDFNKNYDEIMNTVAENIKDKKVLKLYVNQHVLDTYLKSGYSYTNECGNEGGIKRVYPEVNVTKIVVHNNEKNEVIISASDDLDSAIAKVIIIEGK